MLAFGFLGGVFSEAVTSGLDAIKAPAVAAATFDTVLDVTNPKRKPQSLMANLF
jgi:hypothetical protein